MKTIRIAFSTGPIRVVSERAGAVVVRPLGPLTCRPP
jgi:hypothetical protein